MPGLEFPVFFIAIVLLILFSAIKILREYERGVIFLLGRFWKVKGPGIIVVVPGVQQMVRVDLRTIVMDVPTQDVISRDNVSVRVSAVIYFRVMDPEKAVIQIENRVEATSQLAQTTLRSVLGRHELDDMLAERDKLNADIQAILDDATEAWGIKVTNVEIKHVDLDESMIRAIAAQAEAERSRRAKVIHAEGEFQASKRLADAAQVLSAQPQALQLRFLQTLTDIASERNSHTIVFPVPLDLIRPLMDTVTSKAARRDQPPREIDTDFAPEIDVEPTPAAEEIPPSRIRT
jgi:regulator of protease activity HflC (stomatin/prohibitin superfamily)